MKEKQDLGSLLPQRTLVKGVGHTKTHAECWLRSTPLILSTALGWQVEVILHSVDDKSGAQRG